MGARSRFSRQRHTGHNFRARRAASQALASKVVCAELDAREQPTGFSLRFQTTPSALADVLDELGFEALQPVSLECGGRPNGTQFQGFVTRWKGLAVEADRRSVSVWLQNNASVLDFDLGKLIDY